MKHASEMAMMLLPKSDIFEAGEPLHYLDISKYIYPPIYYKEIATLYYPKKTLIDAVLRVDVPAADPSYASHW